MSHGWPVNAVRLKLAKPEEALVLPDVISKEPLGPAVRQGDDQWFTIVSWTLSALINAEELEVNAAGVDALKTSSKKPDVRRLLGIEGTFGADMGLDADWAARAIKAAGNYGENVRAQSRQGLAAGHRARIERVVEQGRAALRAAGEMRLDNSYEMYNYIFA